MFQPGSLILATNPGPGPPRSGDCWGGYHSGRYGRAGPGGAWDVGTRADFLRGFSLEKIEKVLYHHGNWSRFLITWRLHMQRRMCGCARFTKSALETDKFWNSSFLMVHAGLGCLRGSAETKRVVCESEWHGRFLFCIWQVSLIFPHFPP